MDSDPGIDTPRFGAPWTVDGKMETLKGPGSLVPSSPAATLPLGHGARLCTDVVVWDFVCCVPLDCVGSALFSFFHMKRTLVVFDNVLRRCHGCAPVPSHTHTLVALVLLLGTDTAPGKNELKRHRRSKDLNQCLCTASVQFFPL